jgi:type IV pilus assembly protein PilP
MSRSSLSLKPSLLLKLLSVAISTLTLAACSGSGGDDLDKFMLNAANDMSKGVEPLPEVLPYSPLQYNADGTLADPFKPRKAAGKNGTLQPNTNRPKEALESYPLESLQYVGSMSKSKLTYALIKTPDNTIQQIKVGNYLGPNYGLVTAINESDIALKEIVQDDLTGDWTERTASINLQE